ncbi:MAG: hypothetical protein AABY68_07090 [Pseudomonadota bacterium]
MRAQSDSPAWQRGGQLLALMLALSVIFVPTEGFSWPLGLLGALLVGLPLLLAEQAMAARSKQPGIAGMQALTREADAARGWRFPAYAGLALSLAVSAILALVSGLLLTQVVQTLWQPLTSTLGLAASAAPAGTALWPVLTLLSLLIALGRSFRTVPMWLWLIVTLVLLALLALQMVNHQTIPLVTDLGLLAGLPNAGAANASLLAGALVMGGGMGAAATLRLSHGELKSSVAAPAIAALFIVCVLALHQGSWCVAAALLGVVVTQLGLSASLAPALAEARQRNLPALAAPLAVIIPVTLLAEALWLWGDVGTLSLLVRVTAVALALNLLVLSIYAGWIMKISHLRKAVNLPSELTYNLLRIALRWLAPITLLIALAKAWGLF